MSHDGNDSFVKYTLEQTPLKMGALSTFLFCEVFSFWSLLLNPIIDNDLRIQKTLFECDSYQTTGSMSSLQFGSHPVPA